MCTYLYIIYTAYILVNIIYIHIYRGGNDAFKCNMSVCQYCSRNGNANKLCATDTNQPASFLLPLTLLPTSFVMCVSVMVIWFL